MSPLLARSEAQTAERTAVSARSAASAEDERAAGLESWSRGLRRQASRVRSGAARTGDDGRQLVALGQRAQVDGQTAIFRPHPHGGLAAAGGRLQEQGRQVEEEGRRVLLRARREEERAAALERTAAELEREAGSARRRAAGLRMRAEMAERRGTLTCRLRRRVVG